MALEEGLDLGFVNYRVHPNNKDYYVFRFKDQERAQTFKEELDLANIRYESSEQQMDSKLLYLFAVHYRHFQQVQEINFNTEAKHRHPFMKDRLFRYFVLVITIGLIILAIISYNMHA